MKRKISEFAYGFTLTHELIHTRGYLPTDKAAHKKKKADEPAQKGYPLFLQFKASEYMKRRNAGESKLVGLPYFRFGLHRQTLSSQHQMLIELERRGSLVFYATPKMHEAVNLNSAFFDHQVTLFSLFVSPQDVGELPDKDAHRVVFSARTEDVYFCPQQKRLDRAINGEQFDAAITTRLAELEPAELNDDFYQSLAAIMVELVSPNRRIFDELSRGKLAMSAATFANYLAKTLFDCELLVIPAGSTE